MKEPRGRLAYAGGRVSPQRAEIADAARRLKRAFTIDELLGEVRRRRPGIGVATVYRAVAALQASGWIEPVGTAGGTTLWAHCAHDTHHHHVVCTGCGAVALADCPVPESRVDTAEGRFVITRHEVELYGLCPKCASGEAS